MSGDVRNARRMLIGTATIAFPATFGLAAAIGMRIDYQSIWLFVAWIVPMIVLGSLYCKLRQMPVLRFYVETAGIGILLTPAIVISTYLALFTAKPLADEGLAGIDMALGLDWRSFIQYVDERPFFSSFLAYSYQSFSIQLLSIPLLLACFGQAARAYQMVTAYVLVGFSASVVAIWFPAIGAFPHFGVGPEQLNNINIYFGYFFLEQFGAVRSDPNFVFSMKNSAGIVTFPSVHAAVSALCAWAAWAIKPLRYPILILNIGMAVSAVTHGSHYFIDVPVGILLAFSWIGIISALTSLRWNPHPAAVASPA
jgi:membrane-associated phospholipid phosphatase